MPPYQVPKEIEYIFDHPGLSWSADDRDRVKIWLHRDPQYPILLRVAVLNGARTAMDAEDFWSEFCLRRLDGVINSYDPDGPKAVRFWLYHGAAARGYLLTCYQRECWKYARREDRRTAMTVPVPVDQPRQDMELPEFELPDLSHLGNPEEAAQVQAFFDLLLDALANLKTKNVNHYIVFIEHRLNDRRIEDIAYAYGLRENTVSQYNRRAGQNIVRWFRANHPDFGDWASEFGN